MTEQFSYLQFLRRIPLELLEKYFAAKGIDLGVDFKRLGKNKENVIFQEVIV